MSARCTRPLALTLSMLALFTQRGAHAQASTGERSWDESAGHRLTLEQGLAFRGGARASGGMGLFCESSFPGVILPTDDCPKTEAWADVLQLGARVRVHADGLVDEPGGAIVVEVTSALRVIANERARTGPLFVGASVGWLERGMSLRGTLGMGIPVFAAFDGATAPYVTLDDQLLRGAFGHEGAWLSDRKLPVMLQIAFEGRHELFFAGADVATSVMVGWGQWRFASQLGGFAGVQPIDIVAVGARAQVVVEGQPEVDDWVVPLPAYLAAHVSIVPFVRLDTRPVFAEVRLLLNLDDSYGIAFDRGAVWSLTATIGTELL